MNPKSNWSLRKYHLPRNFTLSQLLDQVKIFISHQYQYQVLENYYIGRHDILNRSMNDASKPNNKVVNNFAKLIVDTNASYFLGKPITYVGNSPDTVKTMSEWLSSNDARDVDAELSKLCSMMGHAFEFHWINSDGEHKFKYVSPMNVLAIYSADLDEELLCAVNISQVKNNLTGETITSLEVYDDKTITRYQYGADESPKLLGSKPHLFGEVPVIEYIANDERQGDFESIITQIDAYDQVVSDSVNDVEYFNDSYLLLKDLNATTTDDILEMKQNRVLMVDGTGDASFLTRTINDVHIENIKDRLVQDIHKMSQTPNLSDEQFATNLSGTAIRYKMLSLENRTAMRERKFTKAIFKRLRLAFKTLGLKGKELVNDIHPVFVRNLPANLVELADMTIKLKDIVSDETLRSQLPFVTDLEKEAKLVEEQKQKEQEMTLEMKMFPSASESNDPQGNGTNNNGQNTHNLQKTATKE
jgi:SPP1 family phage portal protein